jgi:hypothetical protein
MAHKPHYCVGTIGYGWAATAHIAAINVVDITGLPSLHRDDGGSALLTAGCHALDALLMLMGHDVESVTSLSTKSASTIFKPYEYDTSSVTPS